MNLFLNTSYTLLNTILATSPKVKTLISKYMLVTNQPIHDQNTLPWYKLYAALWGCMQIVRTTINVCLSRVCAYPEFMQWPPFLLFLVWVECMRYSLANILATYVVVIIPFSTFFLYPYFCTRITKKVTMLDFKGKGGYDEMFVLG